MMVLQRIKKSWQQEMNKVGRPILKVENHLIGFKMDEICVWKRNKDVYNQYNTINV